MVNWVKSIIYCISLFLVGCISLVSAVTEINFTSTTSWTVPSGIVNITVDAVGGGGAGGGGTGNGYYFGGGGGAFSSSYLVVTPGESLTINVGASVAGSNANGANGNPSNVSRGATTLVHASAGLGGTGSSAGQGGQATNCIGTIRYNGGNGYYAASSISGGGGGAGTSGAGGSATSGTGGTGTSQLGGNGGDGGDRATGGLGSNYGGGGGGTRKQGSGGTGGDGAQGIVRIRYDSIVLSSPSTNQSPILIGDSVNHTITINTTGVVGTYVFAWNASGVNCDTWANITTVVLGSGSNIRVGFNQTIPSACSGKNIAWQVWANNTVGNYNASLVDSYEVMSSSCIYLGTGDWVITKHCNMINTNYNVAGLVNISDTGWLNISGNSILNATRIFWYPRDAEEPFRLRWYSPAKIRWG